VVQNCGPLRFALDIDFLHDLAKHGTDVKDTRVAQGMATMLQRNVFVLTSSRTDGVSSTLYRPFNPPKKQQPTITIGHIKDHHFVPLQKNGMHKVKLVNVLCLKKR
jgi:hypothetical protein